LRLLAGLEACAEGDRLWVRGPELPEPLGRVLRILPARRFRAAADGVLFRPGRRVPAGRLPAGPWTPLRTHLVPEAPPAALPGEPPGKIPLRLVRSGREAAAGLLVTPLAGWAAWALAAPLVRLRPLSFAVAADGRAAVAGSPLPPIPGVPFTRRGGIAVPCGLDLDPPVDAAVLGEVLGLEPGDVALFGEDGSWERVEASSFVAAGRGAVRATLGGRPPEGGTP